MIQKGVRVNAIAPGWVRVENHEKVLGGEFDWGTAERGLPAGFIGIPADIGKLAIFLSSDESRYIIGPTLVADGGQLAIMPNSGDFRGPSEYQWGKDYVDDLNKSKF